MALTLVTDVTTEPLSLAEAKAHCRIDHDDENALVASLIVAAREYAETFTHRALAPQTWEDTRDTFPNGVWVLPKPPVTSVTSVTYVDGAGDTQTWAASNYTTDLPAGRWAACAKIVPVYATFWPITRAVINAVTVRFVCGYSTTPEAIKAAMKLLIGHWYKNRETSVIGNQNETLVTAVDSLLWPFKAF
jgi:uncharacterized phiE125 gp8 family phage protein